MIPHKHFQKKDVLPKEANPEDVIKACEPHHFTAQDGKVVGKHNGAHYFTIGQRRGLNVGGMKAPLFVIGTDVNENIIYVGMGKEHPGLFRAGLFIPAADLHWVRPDLEMKTGEVRDYHCRIRYRQALVEARLHRYEEGMYITFSEMQRGITPGQFAAWYDGEELIGSGVIA